MAWFKIDDKLPDNRKARAVRKSHATKSRDVAPFGLWTVAGAWSDDGWVPLEWLEDWDDDAEELAERLVDAGLWHKTIRDGEPGYIFHDWHDQNPVKDDLDPSSTGTFGNHIRWHVQRKIVHPDCDHCPNEPDESSADDRPDIAPISPPDIGVIGSESLPSRPDPIPDPIPTRPEPTTLADQSAAREADSVMDRFDEFWDTYGHKVKRPDAERKWRLALKKPGVTADLLINAAAAYVLWERQNNEGGRFIAHPSTWLHNERWRDERKSLAAPQTNVERHLQLARDLAEREQSRHERQADIQRGPRQIGGPA